LNRLEYEILLGYEVAEQAELIRNVSRCGGDVLCSLAEVAYQGTVTYMVEGREITIIDGRPWWSSPCQLVLCRIRRSWEGEEGEEKRISACPDLVF